MKISRFYNRTTSLVLQFALSNTPKQVFFKLLLVNLLLIIICASSTKDPSYLFQDYRPVTYFSFLQLLAVALLAYAVYRERINTPISSRRVIFWRLVSFGFVFVAVDEVIKIHERLDEHVLSRIQFLHTVLERNLDDLIVAAYGLVGILLACFLWKEAKLFLSTWVYFIFAIICFLIMVFLDMITHYPELFLPQTYSIAKKKYVLDWLDVIEDSFKLVAEVGFIAWIAACLHKARVLKGGVS